MKPQIVQQALSFAETALDDAPRHALEEIAATLATEVRRLQRQLEDARERNPAVAMVDASDEGYFAEILPDRTVHVGDMLYAFPPLSTDSKHWTPSFNQWWEAHGQFLRAGGGQYEKTFAYHAFEAAAALYGAVNTPAKANHLRALRTTATWPKWMRNLRLAERRREKAMSESTPSKHSTLLNALCEMQNSPVYAARKEVLQKAELTIYRQEQELLNRDTVVPPGMVLVPEQPSGDRIRAFTKAFNHGNGDFNAAWVLLLSGEAPRTDLKPAGWKGKGRIKVGAKVWHDFQAFVWPGCKPSQAEYEDEERWEPRTKYPDAVFEVTWGGDHWECVGYGYGVIGTNCYGNGSIAVFAYDSVEIVEESSE